MIMNKIKELQGQWAAQSKAYLWLLNEVSGIANNKTIGSETRHRLLNLLNNHDELFSYLFEPELTSEIRPGNIVEIKSL